MPGARVLSATLHDNAAAALVAAFVPPRTQPSWLSVAVTGSAPQYSLVLNITSTNLGAGQNSAVLTVSTTDVAGTVLQTQDVTVNYIVLEPMGLSGITMRPTFVFGHSTTSSADTFLVFADPTTQWAAASDQPWVTAPSGNVTGPGNLSVNVDASPLPPGISTAVITVANLADPSDKATLTVTATVNEPTLSATPSPVVIGNDDGLDFTSGKSVQISYDTGTNSWPFTAALSTESGVNWLSATPTSGNIGSTAATLTLNGDRSLVTPGSYPGTLRVSTTIKGRTLTRDVPVKLNKEAHWLHVSGLGTAFSSFPGRSVLTRSFEVRSSQGRSDVPWTAVSSQAWLDVTASGHTGDDLVLTAHPAGLANGQYYATITVSSSQPDILNTQVMRVGLRVGGADPAEVSIPASSDFVVANPVEPYVYANSSGENILVCDVYDGSVVRTFNIPGAGSGAMAVSHDGRTLFVNDHEARKVHALDAESGAWLREYPWPAGGPGSSALAYLRPDAHPLLILGGGTIFDADTAALHATSYGMRWYDGRISMAGDVYDNFLYTLDKVGGPALIEQHQVRYTALLADGVSTKLVNNAWAGGFGYDLCVSPDAMRLYAAAGAYEFATMSLQFTRLLEGGNNNAVCGWNGVFLGGSYVTGPHNVWAYRPDGTEITRFNMHPAGGGAFLRDDTLVLSGDNTRVIGSTGFPASPSLNFRVAPTP